MTPDNYDRAIEKHPLPWKVVGGNIWAHIEDANGVSLKICHDGSDVVARWFAEFIVHAHSQRRTPGTHEVCDKCKRARSTKCAIMKNCPIRRSAT